MNKHNLTPNNYYDSKDYMSVSLWKKLNKCEMDGKLPWINDWSTPLLVGGYVDAYVEGELEQFKIDHPEIISTRGQSKGQLKSDFKLADKIIEKLDGDPLIQQFLSGEKQTIMVGEIEGVPFKIKMDSYAKGICISDLKIMRSITNKKGDYIDFISQWRYDIQLAGYQEIVFQNTGERLPCYIVVLTKESPINSAIIQIPQEILDKALYEIQSTINHFWDVYKGEIEATPCGKCKTCIESRTTPLLSMMDIME